MPALTRVTPLGPPYVDGWTFVAPVVEMPVYLRWLVGRLEELGGTMTRMALSALPDQAEVVVNATGLGARRMADDPSMVPVRGQVVYVEQVGLERWWLDGGRSGYVVPRSGDIVVGGTDDEGEWDRRPDPDVAKLILEARRSSWCPRWPARGCSATRSGCVRRVPSVRLEAEHVERPPGRALLRARRRRRDAVVGLRGRGRRARRLT